MIIYQVNFILITVYAFFTKVSKDFSKRSSLIPKFLLILFTLQLIAIQTFRGFNVGNDVERYVSYFILSSDGSGLSYRYEEGFKMLVYVLSSITSNPTVFLGVVSCLSLIPFMYFVAKESKMPYLSLMLYIAFNFYAFTFSGLRQSIAFGLVFLSFKYIHKRNIKVFVLLCLAASMFHSSALLFVPAYYIFNVKLDTKKYFMIILASILVFISRKHIFSIVIGKFFPMYTIVESTSFTWLLANFTLLLLIRFVFTNAMRDSRVNGIYNIVFAGIILMVFSSVGTNVMRMSNYYFMFIVILIPELTMKIKEYRLRLVACLFIIIAASALFQLQLRSDSYNIVPYQSFNYSIVK